MTTDRPWPASLTSSIGGQIKRYRQERGYTSAELAKLVSDAGLPYTRDQVVNLERTSGRRTSVTVGELMAFAAALGVAPALLIAPVGDSALIEYLPGHRAEPWRVFTWVTEGSEDLMVRAGFPAVEPISALLSAYHAHQHAVADLTMLLSMAERNLDESEATRNRIEDKIEVLVARRDAMRARGWSPPTLSPDINELVDIPGPGWRP
jgi:transcriptional regulator with XRE-family HTH domain